MSILTESLEYIDEWLQQNKPSIISYLEPGLRELEIRNILDQDFPFLLPAEFYEIYHWHNGTAYGDYGEKDFIDFFPGCIFHSLEYALEIYRRELEIAERFASRNHSDPELIFSRKWLPIFTQDDDEYLCILGNEEEALPVSPILAVFGGASVRYTSLTGMMQAIASCYAAGAYYLDEEGILMSDHAISEQIRMEYNEGASFH